MTMTREEVEARLANLRAIICKTKHEFDAFDQTAIPCVNFFVYDDIDSQGWLIEEDLIYRLRELAQEQHGGYAREVADTLGDRLTELLLAMPNPVVS